MSRFPIRLVAHCTSLTHGAPQYRGRRSELRGDQVTLDELGDEVGAAIVTALVTSNPFVVLAVDIRTPMAIFLKPSYTLGPSTQ